MQVRIRLAQQAAHVAPSADQVVQLGGADHPHFPATATPLVLLALLLETLELAALQRNFDEPVPEIAADVVFAYALFDDLVAAASQSPQQIVDAGAVLPAQACGSA